MKKQLIALTALCAAGLVFQAQAQSSSSSGYPSSSSSSSQSGWTGRHLRSGQMGHQEIEAKNLQGAQVTSTSGTELGTIQDCIINPTSGRIDFAVISLTGAGASATGSATSPAGSATGSATSPSGTSSETQPGTAGSSSSSSGTASLSGASGKQVAVPWMLLRSSSAGASSHTTATAESTSGQQTFVFSGDASKLQSAPSFTSTDLSQPSWKHSVFSYFGVSGRGSAMGGAEFPSGSSSSQGTSSGSATTPPSSSSGR